MHLSSKQLWLVEKRKKWIKEILAAFVVYITYAISIKLGYTKMLSNAIEFFNVIFISKEFFHYVSQKLKIL